VAGGATETSPPQLLPAKGPAGVAGTTRRGVLAPDGVAWRRSLAGREIGQ
jgi:hypothetical protein